MKSTEQADKCYALEFVVQHHDSPFARTDLPIGSTFTEAVRARDENEACDLIGYSWAECLTVYEISDERFGELYS